MRVRIFNIIILLLLSSVTFAQKKEISAARDNVKKGKNLENAEQSMRKLLQDSSNRQNVKVWDVLFESLRKQYEQGNEKLYLKQKYDTLSLFNTASRMFTAMTSYDSIDVLPDKKGRVKLAYRKNNSELLNTLRPNLYNGGLFLLRKQKYEDAFKLFNQYLDCANQPLFGAFNYTAKDKLMPEAAYWAVYSAYKMKDAEKVLHHAPLALTDSAHHELTSQYLSETYQMMKDTTKYLSTLSDGFQRYPLSSFFYPRLIEYYSQEKKWDDALALTNNALEIDSTKTIFHLTKSSILLNKGLYEQSFAISDSLLQLNDSLPEANLNAGLAKFNQAVTLDKLTHSAKEKRVILSLYKVALPYLEKYRKMSPDRIDAWGLPLYTIYLNLNKGKQFDEIDQLLNK